MTTTEVAEAPIPTDIEAAPSPEPAPEATAQKADRGYIVLRKADELRPSAISPSNPPLDVWVYVSTIEASSAEQAVRRAVEQPGTSFLDPEGPTTLVAVPSRSWNPTNVTVKTETSIVLS